MVKNNVNVRELEQKDISLLADYWFTADAAYLKSMGVDVSKLPTRQQFEAMIDAQAALPYPEKRAYALIWELNGEAIGHCNLNPVYYGDHGFMHLHIWKPAVRQMGLGEQLVKMSLPWFFNKMDINKLLVEPYALNTAPNRVLKKTGFKFVKEYITTPGAITFEQPVKQWIMEKP